jgi:3-deoxy-D-manno-octulosonate 8-phosphate phosphatase KdsC-like HAD superfamily phosphatase
LAQAILPQTLKEQAHLFLTKRTALLNSQLGTEHLIISRLSKHLKASRVKKLKINVVYGFKQNKMHQYQSYYTASQTKIHRALLQKL